MKSSSKGQGKDKAITIGGTPDEQLFTPLIDKEVSFPSFNLTLGS